MGVGEAGSNRQVGITESSDRFQPQRQDVRSVVQFQVVSFLLYGVTTLD